MLKIRLAAVAMKAGALEGSETVFGGDEAYPTSEKRSLKPRGINMCFAPCQSLSYTTKPNPTTPPTVRRPSLRPPLPHLLILKVQTNTINTMPLIRRRRVPLPLKHMPQVPAAVRARNLRPCHAEGAVGVADDSAGDGIEVGGPAAAGFELMGGAVEGRGAGGAGVGAGRGGVLIVGAGEGGFGAFFAEDAELFC